MAAPPSKILVGITAFVVVVSAIWYVRDAQGPDALHVSDVQTALRPNGGDTDLLFSITLDNPTAATARVSNMSFTVLLNDRVVDQGVIEMDTEVAPASAGALEGSAHLPGGFADGLWPSHVERGEATVIEVKGNVSVRQAGTDDVLDFSTHDEWRTDLLDAIQVPRQECPEEGPDVCVEEVRFYWSTSDDQPALRALMRLHNPHPFAVRVNTAVLGLSWDDRTVANGTLESSLLIDPQATQTIDWVMPFNQTALDEWWVRHVEDCQPSTMTLSADLAFEGVGTIKTASAEASFAQLPENGNETDNGTYDGADNGTDTDPNGDDPAGDGTANQSENSTAFGQGGNETGNETGNNTGGNETGGNETGSDGTDGGGDGTSGDGSGDSGSADDGNEDEQELDFEHATTWEQDTGTLKAGFPCSA